MPHKDPEKYMEYHREWRKKNPNYMKEWRKKKDPDYEPRKDSYHDFETHRELAINSGIENSREWHECFKLGLMPDGIYLDPYQAFRRE